MNRAGSFEYDPPPRNIAAAFGGYRWMEPVAAYPRLFLILERLDLYLVCKDVYDGN